jgi:hypothetical protein
MGNDRLVDIWVLLLVSVLEPDSAFELSYRSNTRGT